MKLNKKLLGLLLLHLGLMALVLSSFIGLFFEWVLPVMTKHGQTITVPNLKGIPQNDLHEFLVKRNLQFQITKDKAYSSVYPPAVVLEQYPKPGMHVKEGRTIYLTLNAGHAPEVSMPNLVDSSLKNAQILLRNSGLYYGKIQYVPDIANNAVLGQTYQGQPIAPGTCITQGTRIDLVVGAAGDKQIVAMPSVLGLHLAEAELLLVDLGIQLGNIVYQPVDTLSIGTIFKQSPIPDNQVKSGDTVDLWLVEIPQEPSMLEPYRPILEAVK